MTLRHAPVAGPTVDDDEWKVVLPDLERVVEHSLFNGMKVVVTDVDSAPATYVELIVPGGDVDETSPGLARYVRRYQRLMDLGNLELFGDKLRRRHEPKVNRQKQGIRPPE
ncbi:MAG: hypothetical protein HN348_25350 [Proteobacteria bacterium]|nr:hypothetical protein [Pseudomonadota bacterium]